MLRKRLVNLLQNVTLIALAASAIFLLTQFPMLDGAMAGQMQALLTNTENSTVENDALSGAVAAVHLVVTSETEYGRYARLNAVTDGAEFQSFAPLLREAIGSASATERVTEAELRAALDTPGIYMDLGVALPLSAVAAWLGESHTSQETVCALALVAQRETAMLYFRGENDTVLRCTSALTSTAVRESTAAFAPNGGQFAFESDYDTLAPYSILVQENPGAADVTATLPDGYTAYNLLTALDFNAHTTARYYESNGVEVVVQSPLTLRIGTDGTVQYRADGTVPAGLYQIACAGEIPTAQEALRSVLTLAERVCEGTNASPLSLSGMEQTAQGWTISLCYHVNGVPVRLAEDQAALRVVIHGTAVTEFTYICRTYTPKQEQSLLLPATMAVAIASLQEGAEPMLAYVDNGADVLSVRWLAR